MLSQLVVVVAPEVQVIQVQLGVNIAPISHLVPAVVLAAMLMQ